MVPWQTTAPRPKAPLDMVLQARDIDLFEAIHDFDGLLSDKQIQRLFFNGGERACRYRLSKLWQNGYLNKPSREQRTRLPCMIYWLDSLGAEQVANRHGNPFDRFQWVKRPRWGQVAHDIAVNSFRIDVMQAVQHMPTFELGVWYSEGVFRHWKDVVTFSTEKGVTQKRVTPDGYFEIWIDGKIFRLLFELDMATRDNPNFILEKARPCLAYIKSTLYRQRFGHNAGRVLIVTTTPLRLKYMKARTEAALGNAASVFLFSTFDLVNDQTVLSEPIWYRGGETDPVALLVPHT